MMSLPPLPFLSGDIETYIRWTELLIGIAFAQQSIEHLTGTRSERAIYLPRLLLALLLIPGWQVEWISALLLLFGFLILNRFQGPYNGGSDRLSLLAIVCLTIVHWAPSPYWQEVAFGYLGVQVTLSYFMSGWVKIVNPDWCNGQALRDVFEWSAYPVSESLRRWSTWPRLIFVMSWSVMLLELLFPVALFNRTVLLYALALTAAFHFANACVFGLNRFFWIWIACYPSLLWLQGRLLGEFNLG
jgi:hypothetical protein